MAATKKTNPKWNDQDWAVLGRLFIALLCALVVGGFIGITCEWAAVPTLQTGWLEAGGFLTVLGFVYNSGGQRG